MIRFKKIDCNIKERLPKLAKELRRDKFIAALYLFGSYAKDQIKPLSDIDIAVLLKKNVPSGKYWDLKINLLSKVMPILGTDEVDFVVLNEAPYELCYNILKEGKTLFCHEENWLLEFKEKTVMNYLDTQFLREEGYFHIMERIKSGRFGYDEGRNEKDFDGIRRIFGRTR
jgi:predicted nucleotidyltransferase